VKVPALSSTGALTKLRRGRSVTTGAKSKLGRQSQIIRCREIHAQSHVIFILETLCSDRYPELESSSRKGERQNGEGWQEKPPVMVQMTLRQRQERATQSTKLQTTAKRNGKGGQRLSPVV
jgi:hypothetical protein